jgi:hypothetical protein
VDLELDEKAADFDFFFASWTLDKNDDDLKKLD